MKARRYIVRLMPVEDGTQIEWGDTAYTDMGRGSADRLIGMLPAVYGPRGGQKEPARLVFLVATDTKNHAHRMRSKAR
jgi:hypothetical protein